MEMWLITRCWSLFKPMPKFEPVCSLHGVRSIIANLNNMLQDRMNLHMTQACFLSLQPVCTLCGGRGGVVCEWMSTLQSVVAMQASSLNTCFQLSRLYAVFKWKKKNDWCLHSACLLSHEGVFFLAQRQKTGLRKSECPSEYCIFLFHLYDKKKKKIPQKNKKQKQLYTKQSNCPVTAHQSSIYITTLLPEWENIDRSPQNNCICQFHVAHRQLCLQ